MAEIISFIKNMFPFMIVILVAVIPVRAVSIMLMKKQNLKTSIYHEVFFALFVMFVIGLASQAIVPKFKILNGSIKFIDNNQLDFQLIPFKVFPDTYYQVFAKGNLHAFTINFIGNIVMFMPIGFFVPLLWRNTHLKKVALIGFLSSLFIEICQIPQSRTTDIDDLWLNTLGTLLGYFVFWLIAKVAHSFVEKCKFNR